MAERKNQLFKKKRCLFSFHLIYFLALPYHTCTKWHERKSCLFKNCFPNGIPPIVMHQRKPIIRFPNAISQPKNRIQIKFTKNENIPFPYTISFPKGQNARDANLKHCSPTGIPMIVIHHMHPAKIHASPPNTPPNINQRIFPNVLISASPLSPLF